MKKILIGKHFPKHVSFLFLSLLLLGGMSVKAQAAVDIVTIKSVKTVNSDKQRIYFEPVEGGLKYQLAYKAKGDKKYSRKLVDESTAEAGYAVVGQRLPEVTYLYRVRTCQNLNGQDTWGKWSEVVTSQLNKEVAVYGKEVPYESYGRFYSSSGLSRKKMKAITVKTWDFASGSSGKKITRTWTIVVHKNITTSLTRAFKEIYNDPEKFPIHDLGGWREGSGRSEHYDGTAIDINPDENYQISHGVILCGSCWKPGKNPYSIPTDGVVARILKKYGFSQGIWSSSQDYMHFSYFGT